MRHVAYHKNTGKTHSLSYLYWRWKYRSLGIRCGFSIGWNCIGWATLIPHWGTIVINPKVRIGNYAVLHTSTCIGGDKKTIGNAFYLSTGAMVMRPLTLGNNVQVASNSLVNSSFGDGVLLVGSPASIKKSGLNPWYNNGKYAERVERIEKLRQEMFNK